MDVVERYPVVKPIHVALVLASGGLFVVRGIGVLAGSGWAMVRPLRFAQNCAGISTSDRCESWG